MLPSHHCDHHDLLSKNPSFLQQDHNQLVPTISTKRRQRVSKSGFKENNINDERKLRKIMHRDIEKQRRQEMARLNASLRSLLPPECIKEKRSVSDHIHESMNYIKHMERNIEELRMRKDKMKKISTTALSEKGSSNSVNSLANCVTVSSCSYNGVEISVSCGVEEEDGGYFLLSRVLMELLETELNILSCIFTRTNERIIYIIQSEVNELTYINLPELQQKLANLIKFG